MDLFSNQWVVGIGGGILSGIIVTLLTRYIFSKRDNREYLQKVEAANREVIYALRQGISEGHFPDFSVLNSLINATARKQKIQRQDAYSAKEIAEELIKEIMDSSFISSDIKQEYCETLSHLLMKKDKEDREEPNISRIEKEVIESENRAKFTSLMSVTLGMLAATLTTFSSFFGRFPDVIKGSSSSKLLGPLLPTILVLLVTLFSMFAMITYINIKKNALKKEDNNIVKFSKDD